MRQRFFTQDRIFILIVLVPVIIFVAFLIYYPAANTFQNSLTNWNLRIQKPPKFIQFDNYTKLLGDSEFWEVTLRSFKAVAMILPMEMIIAFGIALLLNEHFRGRTLVRTLVILPWMLPPVVNGFLWGWLLNGDYGALNGLLYQLGIIKEYNYWLQDPQSQLFWVAIVQTWTRFSFPTIILLAGLQSIPGDLYDAAKVDGAGAWQRLIYITFPMLISSFAIALVVEFIASFQIFDVIWTLTAGGSAGGTLHPFTKPL